MSIGPSLTLSRGWTRTWSGTPVPYGTMPGANVFRGTRDIGIEIVALNLAGPKVLLLDGPWLDALADEASRRLRE